MPKKASDRTEKLTQDIISASDICVRCGLCLPHCPTYQISEVETESPRGRIAMAKALADKSVPLTNLMQNHLDHCLSCLACENMCPAKVPYHQLLVNTRELQAQIHPKKLPLLLRFLLKHLSWTPWLQRFYKLYQKSGLLKLFKHTSLGHYSSFMPEKIQIANFKKCYSVEDAKGSVAIFLGCINQLCDATTIFKAIELLNALSYNVHIPKNQACCGAIHTHNGTPLQAEAYLKQNANAFAPLKLEAIFTLASGCHSSLKQWSNESSTATPIIDINAFLLTKDIDATFEINTKTALMIHTPCTVKNSLKQPNLITDLLEKMGLKQIKHLQSYGCCGAAGLTMWSNPKLADALAKPLIEQITAEKPDFVVTANIGCQLHLQKNLRKKGLKTQVIHPINLIFLKKQRKT